MAVRLQDVTVCEVLRFKYLAADKSGTKWKGGTKGWGASVRSKVERRSVVIDSAVRILRKTPAEYEPQNEDAVHTVCLRDVAV